MAPTAQNFASCSQFRARAQRAAPTWRRVDHASRVARRRSPRAARHGRPDRDLAGDPAARQAPDAKTEPRRGDRHLRFGFLTAPTAALDSIRKPRSPTGGSERLGRTPASSRSARAAAPASLLHRLRRGTRGSASNTALDGAVAERSPPARRRPATRPARRRVQPKAGSCSPARGRETVGHRRTIGVRAQRPWKPSSPTSGTNRHGTMPRDRGPSGVRTTTSSSCAQRPPTGTTSRPRELELVVERLRRRRARQLRRRSPRTGRAPGARACRRRRARGRGRRSRPRRGRARPLGELRDPLDRVHLAGELGDHRRLVAGARADVEHALAAARGELLADARDHVRLRDRLPVADRQRGVVVRASAELLRDEQLARDALHRGEHALVVDAARGARRPWLARQSTHGERQRVRLDTEVREHRRGDVGDACERRVDADRQDAARPSRPRRASRGCRRPHGGGRRGRRAPSPRPRRRAARRRSGSRAPTSVARERVGMIEDRRVAAVSQPSSRGRKRSSSPSRRATASSPSRRSVTSTDGSPSSAAPAPPASTRARGRRYTWPARFDAVTITSVSKRRQRRLQAARCARRASGRGRRGARPRSARGTRRHRRPRRAALWIAASVRSSATSSAPSGPCACEAKSKSER